MVAPSNLGIFTSIVRYSKQYLGRTDRARKKGVQPEELGIRSMPILSDRANLIICYQMKTIPVEGSRSLWLRNDADPFRAKTGNRLSIVPTPRVWLDGSLPKEEQARILCWFRDEMRKKAPNMPDEAKTRKCLKAWREELKSQINPFSEEDSKLMKVLDGLASEIRSELKPGRALKKRFELDYIEHSGMTTKQNTLIYDLYKAATGSLCQQDKAKLISYLCRGKEMDATEVAFLEKAKSYAKLAPTSKTIKLNDLKNFLKLQESARVYDENATRLAITADRADHDRVRDEARRKLEQASYRRNSLVVKGSAMVVMTCTILLCFCGIASMIKGREQSAAPANTTISNPLRVNDGIIDATVQPVQSDYNALARQ